MVVADQVAEGPPEGCLRREPDGGVAVAEAGTRRERRALRTHPALDWRLREAWTPPRSLLMRLCVNAAAETGRKADGLKADGLKSPALYFARRHLFLQAGSASRLVCHREA